MTLQQSLDLAELQAEMAFEEFLEACELDDHPAVLDTLYTEAHLAHERYSSLGGNNPAQ